MYTKIDHELSLFLQGRVQQLYVVQCPGVAQQSIADGQCAVLPRDCTQPTQSLSETFAAIGQIITLTVAPTVTIAPPTVRSCIPYQL